MSFMITMRFVQYVPTTLKVQAMFKLLEMIDLCILFNTFLHFFPNNWLRDTCIELDHPPKTSIMILYCVILYPLNFCLSSQRRGPYYNSFPLSFFSRFWIQGQLISRVVTVFPWYYPCVHSVGSNFIIFLKHGNIPVGLHILALVQRLWLHWGVPWWNTVN